MPSERSITVHLYADTSGFVRGMTRAHLSVCALAFQRWVCKLGRSGR